MSAQKEDLSKFRQAIDEIDDEIINLLIKRLDIVKQVGAHKTKTSISKSFIRAGREAVMIKDLSEKAGSAIPAAAIVAMWRTIISISLNTEQNLKITAYINGENKDCYWHAREYYGVFTEILTEKSQEEIVAQVASSDGTIGILPLFDESKTPWWNRPNDEKNEIYVFARVPFFESQFDNFTPSLAIANVFPEKTDDDVSLIVINSHKEAQEILSLLESDISAKIIAENNNAYLLEIADFIAINDVRLGKIKTVFGDSAVRLLGSYSNPIYSN